ncbi:MAG: Ig-like domain-containing protein, partial [Actinomycetota bacterium]|nr:Ig-like domain-containing protein [Actinomycetota bacterium]
MIAQALRLSAIVLVCLFALPGMALADAPYPRPEATTPAHPNPSNPYHYEDYAWIDPGTGDCSSGENPPDETDGDRGLPENFDCDDDWKYTNYAPQPGDSDYDSTVATNPAEYGGVKGSRASLSWEVTTGRPDTVIAVMDSGINWDGRDSVTGTLDGGELNELNGLRKKFFLNSGELPVPGPAACAEPGFGGYDRNCDGIFNVLDYAQEGAELQNPTLDGCTGNCVGDVNANTLIDPEDLILTYSDTQDDDGNGYPDDISGWDFFENDNDPNDDVDFGHGTGESEDSGFEAEAQSTGGGTIDSDGMCPNCMLLEMRVGDSFIADVNHWAEAVVYATDKGASVVQEALGTLNNSSFGQAAADYAYENGVVIVASAADESAAHHNYPSNYDHTMVVNSITRWAGETQQTPRSYLYFNGCTNFGGHIHVGVSSSSCSSEATGRSAGYAGLLYSAARNAIARGAMTPYITDSGEQASYPISAEEAMQMFRLGAEDINFSPTNSTTGYSTVLPVPSRRFQTVEGWDLFFGYGRINADHMLRGVGFVPPDEESPPPIKIPPEADIDAPAWFAPLPATGNVDIEGRVAANRVTSQGGTFDYTVEWAPGAQPAVTGDAGWTEVASVRDQTSAREGVLGSLNMAEVAAAVESFGPTVFDPATDPTSRDLPEKDAFRVRVTVTASDGSQAVFQKQYFVNEDTDLLAGFPKFIGSDGAGSPAFADLDSDGVDELLLSTSDGLVHAYNADGSEVEGWPVYTDPLPLPTTGNNAYTSGGDPIDGPVYGPMLLGSPAVADIVPGDGGDVEVAVADLEGKLYVFNSNGSTVSGFPVSVNPGYSEEPGCEEVDVGTPGVLPPCDDFVGDGTTASYAGALDQRDQDNSIDHGIHHSPAVADIDPSTAGLEILAGAGDNHVYAWHADGSQVSGWPVFLRDPSKVAEVDPQTHKITYREDADEFGDLPGAKVLVAPSIGDLDGDGDLEVVATVNEEYDEEPNASRVREQLGDALAAADQEPGNGRVYALDARGTNADASPADVPAHPNEQTYLPGWPARIAILAAQVLPYVGEGSDGAPTLADVDENGDLEIGIATAAGPGYILDHDGESHFGNGPDGRDVTLATGADEYKGDGTDAPSFVAVGGGSFSELLPGQMAWAGPAAGLTRLLDIVLPAQQLHAEDLISAWDTRVGSFMPGFPTLINDLQFFSVPTSADVSGDGVPEILEGSAVYDVRAVNARAMPVEGWPKFTGGWNIASPGTGDLDGDLKLDVAVITREGWLFVWETDGNACQGIEWSKYQHDLSNSGNYESPTLAPASCGPPPTADAPQRLELTPDQASTETGGVVTLTAAVTDEDGQPVEGAPVEWTEQGPGEFASPPETVTDANGEARAQVTSQEQGDQTVTASTTPCAPTGDCSDTSLVRWEPEQCDISGTEGDDVLQGTSGSEIICGFGGNDRIIAKAGDDVLKG